MKKVQGALFSVALAFLVFAGASPLENQLGYATSSQDIQQVMENNEKLLPMPLSNVDLDHVKNIVISNGQVEQIIGSKQYEFMAQDFVGNQKTHPGVWNPEIHINVGNLTEIVAVIDLSKHSLLNVKSFPISIAGPPPKNPSFGIDYYTGAKTIDGIYMGTKAPSFLSGGDNQFSAFLINALMNGGSDANACNRNFVKSSYWMQAGFNYQYNTPHVTYTDTTFGCIVQNSVSMPYIPGDSYVFYITVKKTTQWYIFMRDETTGTTIVYYCGEIPNSGIFKTSDTDTSIFMESHNKNSNWGNTFPSNLSAFSYVRNHSGLTWQKWDSDKKVDQDCLGNGHPNTIVRGNLQNGNTATWSVPSLARYHC